MIGVRRHILCGFAALMVSAAPAAAEDPPQSDLLNATLWMQRSVEFKATALAVFALAQDPARAGAGRQELDRCAPASRPAATRTCRRL